MLTTNLTAMALQGMERAGAKMGAAARQIASINASGVDTVDLSATAVAMMEARTSFEANAKVMKTAQEMDKHLLDVMG